VIKSEMMRALLAMLVTQAVVVMAAFAAPVLGKQIAGALALPPVLIGYYTSILLAVAMVGSLLSGPLIQRYGPVRVSQATVVLASAGLAALAVGHAAAVLLSALLVGAAYGPGNPASSQLLARTTPPRHRNTIFSLKQTAVPIGVTTAGFATPFLLHAVSWQTAVLILAALCLGAAIAAEPWRAELDAQRPTDSPGFAPLASLRVVFAVPALRRMGIVALVLACVQFGFTAIFAIFLQEAHQVSTASAGSLLSAAMLTSVVMRVALGAGADRIGAHAILVAMAAIMTLSAALLMLSGASFALGAVTGVILAAAAFSWNGVYLAEVAHAAPPDYVASATAGTMFCFYLGGFLGPAIVSTAISLTGAYEAGFAVLAVLGATGMAVLLMPERVFAAAAVGAPRAGE
jgi:MFS family permease